MTLLGVLLISDTYESIDPVNDSNYYCAKDVVYKMPKPQPDKKETETVKKPEIEHVYYAPVEEDKRKEDSDDRHVYNVLAKPEQLTNHDEYGKETLAYNVLEPVTEEGYNCRDDEGLYYCAN